MFFLADISADKQQVLYRSCTATEQDVPGCCNKVVTDILSEKGLCPLHLAADSEVVQYVLQQLAGTKFILRLPYLKTSKLGSEGLSYVGNVGFLVLVSGGGL